MAAKPESDTELRSKIRQNYATLVEKLRPVASYVDTLFSSRYMTTEQCDLVLKCATDHEKARKFLTILLVSEDEALEIFMTRLGEEEMQPYLAKKIMDASVKPRSEGLIVDGFMTRWLQKELEVHKGSVLKVLEVSERLKEDAKEIALNQAGDFSDKNLQQKVEALFPNSVCRGSKATHKRKSDTRQFVNVRWKISSDMTPEAIRSADDCPQQGRVADWSVEEVCGFLRLKHVKEDIVESFQREEISGAVLKPDRDLLDEIHPGMSIGQRRLIMESMTHLLDTGHKSMSADDKQSASKSPIEGMCETYRKFDVASDSLCQYKVGRVFLKTESQPSNLLDPIHRYVPSLGTEDVSEVFSEETLKFAAACMNERTNGTIHFGVGDGRSDRYAEGQILGINVDRTELTKAFEDAIMDGFRKDKVSLAQHCIRPPDFILAISEEKGQYKKYVVEVDIVPEPEMCQGKLFDVRTRRKKQKSKGSADWTAYHLKRVVPTALSRDELISFPESQIGLDRLRASKGQTEENTVCAATISPISKKALQNRLIDLLCCGEENLNGEIFPVLVVSSPSEHMSRKWMKKNLSFIKRVPWRVVFDFGDGGDSSLFRYLANDEEQATRVLTSESFDPRADENNANAESLKTRLDNLRSSFLTPWIFVNGYHGLDKESLSLREWKKERVTGFKEAVRFFNIEIPLRRATVLFLILSQNLDVLIEAADELCTRFKNKWFILAEKEKMVQTLWSEFLSKCIVGSKQEIEERSIIGMPFSHVNDTVQQLVGCDDDTDCLIPASTGQIKLRKKVKNALLDLDIVATNQCDDSDITNDAEKLNEFGQTIEEKYYKGPPVDWWNFWFQSHVLHRACHDSLMEAVSEVLKGGISDDERVGRVMLQHQPGAGGTTSARQILWDLRKQYRCAVIKNLTDQTADQIQRLHIYEDEENPRPLLLLLDNFDDERVSELKAQLEEQCRSRVRQMKLAPSVFYVFLVCRRRSSFDDITTRKNHNLLEHFLQPEEQQWFKDKYQQLEKNYKEQKEKGKQRIEPRLLMSFNILKENFNKDYINRNVKELTNEIKNPSERDLLKYVTLLNTYDLSFRPLRAAAFDGIMASVLPTRQLPREEPPRWENHISSALKVLLNETGRPRTRKECGIRIISNLLSKIILEHLLLNDPNGDQRMATGEVMMQFLECGIFNSRLPDEAVQELLKVVGDLMKKRARKPNGMYETKFSPMIQAIVDDKGQGVPVAADVLKMVFDLSDDVFVAQHLARLYIHHENWKEATRYAKMITNMKPSNSFLWDTYGNVFKGRLNAHCNHCVDEETTASVEDAIQVIDLALDGLEVFHQEQSISRKDETSVDHAGYFGEMEVIVRLLFFLTYIGKRSLKDTDGMHQFLIDPVYVPEELECLGRERINKLKSLQQQSLQVMTHLEDEFLHLKDDVSDPFRRNCTFLHNLSLVKLKEDLQNYFGEDSNEPPANLSDENKCSYRRRRIIRLGGTSFKSISHLTKSEQDGHKLDAIRELVDWNLKSPFRNSFDLQTKIRVSIAMSIISSRVEQPDLHMEMAEMSKALYEQEISSLERYLFACMFNWPRDNPDSHFALHANKIPKIMKEWKLAYYEKYPTQQGDSRQRKKETTMFFLAKGSGMNAFAHNQELPRRKRGTVWRSPEGIDRLQRIAGTLTEGGREICTHLEERGAKSVVAFVPTSLPINDHSMWNQPVYFVLGFTWSGPKAYDVAVENPETLERVESKEPETYRDSSEIHLGLEGFYSYMYFQKELDSIWDKLQTIRFVRSKKESGARITQREAKLLREESALHERREKLVEKLKRAKDVLGQEMY